MAKAQFRTVVFIEDFANKKKGEEFRCDGLLANQLVNGDKVAKYKSEEPAKEKVEVVEQKEKVVQSHIPKKRKEK